MSGPARNSMCPCGSGKKYKRCCLDKIGTASKLPKISDNKTLICHTFSVTFDPIEDSLIACLPQEDQEKYQHAAHDLTVHHNGLKTLPVFQELVRKYPHVPIFHNNLLNARQFLGQEEEVEKGVIELYRQFPNYLFAKLGQATLYLRQEKIDLIPEIFNQTFDLKMLYPDRELFHIMEVRAFYHFLGRYFFYTGREDQLACCHGLLADIDRESKEAEHLEELLDYIEVKKVLLDLPAKAKARILKKKSKKSRTQKISQNDLPEQLSFTE